jgi:hypothetical protein
MDVEMTITIEDYLSKEEIVEEIKFQIQKKVNKDAERILSNTAYGVVFEAVDKALDGKMQETIKTKVIEIIGKLSSFELFREKNAYGDPQSFGMAVLNNAIEENRPVIKARVKEVVDNFDINKIIEERLDSSLEDILLTVLKDGLNHNR